MVSGCRQMGVVCTNEPQPDDLYSAKWEYRRRTSTAEVEIRDTRGEAGRRKIEGVASPSGSMMLVV